MNIAVLLSGGIGLRMGLGIPKQYIRVWGKMLITYSLETLLAHPMIDAVQIVAEPQWQGAILADVRENDLEREKICGFSSPGEGRQASVLNALKDIRLLGFPLDAASTQDGVCGVCRRNILRTRDAAFPGNAVLIHDAVRPNLAKEQITGCFDALRGHDGVMPVLPMKDTVYQSDGGECISKLLDREKIFAGQAPEVFDFDKYYTANMHLASEKLLRIKGSAEPAVMAGMDIAMIPGDENNYKITTKVDLERFRKQKEGDMQKATGNSR